MDADHDRPEPPTAHPPGGTAPGSPAASGDTTARRPRPAVAAFALLAGPVLSLVGISWDVQWHADVGPDTFFTLPHLFLYAGSAIAGLVSLAVVLATTAATRAGRPVDTAVGGPAVSVFGRTFAAPVGYLVAGVGAAMFLLFGLWDEWWHTLYGFDAVIVSPPHIALLSSVSVTMLGAAMVFAAARPCRWARVGLVVALAVLLAFSSLVVLAGRLIPGPVDTITLLLVVLSVVVIAAAAGTLRRPGAAVAVAAVLLGIQVVLAWFSPWAARWYAQVSGLPVRDYVEPVAQMPALMPGTLLVAALVLEALLWLGRLRRWPAQPVVVAAGVLAGTCLALTHPLQLEWFFGQSLAGDSSPTATLVVSVVLGGLAARFGWQAGAILRLLAPESRTTPPATAAPASPETTETGQVPR